MVYISHGVKGYMYGICANQFPVKLTPESVSTCTGNMYLIHELPH